MNDNILTTIIASAFTLLGVIITVVVTNRKRKMEIEYAIKRQQEQIDEINEKLETHNNYAIEIPLMKKDISYIRESIGKIEKKVGV